MAINFGDTIMEGSIEPSAKVQAPVMDNSEAIRISAGVAEANASAVLADSLGTGLNMFGKIAGSIFKQNQENASSKVLTQYQNDLLDIADSVDQGIMSRNEAMTKARNLRRQYLGNAPALQGEFDDIWTDFASANGLGHVVVEGTLEERAANEMRQTAIKLGYTPQEFSLFQSRTRQATELNYQLTQAENSGKLITETQRLQGLQAIVGVAESAYPSAQRQINEAMSKINANPSSKEQVATELNTVLGNSIAQLKYMGGSADSNYIVAPIEQAMATFNQWVNGEVSNSVMEGTLKGTQLKYDLMYASDPTLGPVIAASKVIGEIGMQNSQLFGELFTPQVIQKFGDMANPNKTVNLIDSSDGSARTAEAIKQSAGEVTPDSDPELIQEINNAIGQAVDSAYVHERSAEGPLGFKSVVELLGSAEVGAFLSAHGKIDSKYADQFVQVLKSNYEQGLLPVVNQVWADSVPISETSFVGAGVPGATVTGGEAVPMSQLIQPRWNGNAVEFVPRPEYLNDPRVIDLANEATSGNNSIGIPLNNLINAYSNVTGVDAKQIYEQDFAGRLFNVDADGNPLETTTPVTPISFATEQDLTNSTNPRNLTLEDFQPEELEKIVVETQAAEPEAVLNATNPVEFAQSFIGRTEENAEDVAVLSSFIKETAGININPAQTAWCAAFVDAVLNATGSGKGTGKLNARSYLNWGQEVSEPKVGDVVVMWRGQRSGWKGHVGFYAGTNEDGTIKVLGGNQGDSVSFDNFDPDRVLGYRRAI